MLLMFLSLLMLLSLPLSLPMPLLMLPLPPLLMLPLPLLMLLSLLLMLLSALPPLCPTPHRRRHLVLDVPTPPPALLFDEDGACCHSTPLLLPDLGRPRLVMLLAPHVPLA
jgi:hypothetical protein